MSFRPETSNLTMPAQAFVDGRISGADYMRLHAVRLRLDAALPEWDRI